MQVGLRRHPEGAALQPALGLLGSDRRSDFARRGTYERSKNRRHAEKWRFIMSLCGSLCGSFIICDVAERVSVETCRSTTDSNIGDQSSLKISRPSSDLLCLNLWLICMFPLPRITNRWSTNGPQQAARRSCCSPPAPPAGCCATAAGMAAGHLGRDY